MKKIILCAVLSLTLVGCGTLLYPERQGQTSGKLDPVVLALNGAGLLLYVIPGLVAFAIDFHQGTIYLPGTDDLTQLNQGSMQTISFGEPLTEAEIESVISQRLGVVVDLSNPNVQITALKSLPQSAKVARLDDLQ